MNIEFVKKENNQEWEDLVFSLPNYSFLNSSARLDFVSESKKETLNYIIKIDGQNAGILNGFIGHSKIFGKFLELKHSPILKKEFNSEEAWNEIFGFIKDLGRENNCFMYRVAPLYKENPALMNVYNKLKMKEAPIHNVDALISQYFDLSKSEEELRSDMSSSTRNNINKLMKNEDISIKIVNDNSAFDIFRKFHDQTTKLKSYIDTPIDTLMLELQKQVDNGMCHMVVGYYQNKPISIWQCTVYGKYMHIYQAGSDTEFRQKNVRITYLLFWESLKLAKELGCKTLDLFGGMVPENYQGDKHPWKGVNSFKESLGGSKTTYLHTRDYPLNKIKYMLYYYYSTLRVKMKGYTIKW